MNSVKVLLLLLLISSCAFCGISQRKDDCRPMEQIAGESEIVIIGTMVARYRVETTRFDIMKVDEVIKGCVKGAHIICSYDYHGDYGEFENEIGYRWL